jgi:hypothetical protein
MCSENNMKDLHGCEFLSKYGTAVLFILFPYKLMCTCFFSGNFGSPFQCVTLSLGCLMMKCDYYQALPQNLY